VIKHTVVFEARTQKNHLRYIEPLRSIARKNRSSETQTEDIIWNKLLRGKKLGFKFTRQKPIGKYVADFYCSQLALIIEIDGSSHDQKKNTDFHRDSYLKSCGIVTIRYLNDDVLKKIYLIEKDLLKRLQDRAKKIGR